MNGERDRGDISSRLDARDENESRWKIMRAVVNLGLIPVYVLVVRNYVANKINLSVIIMSGNLFFFGRTENVPNQKQSYAMERNDVMRF